MKKTITSILLGLALILPSMALAEPVYEPKPYVGVSGGFNTGVQLTLGAELNEYFSLETALRVDDKVIPSATALVGMEYGFVRPYVALTTEYDNGFDFGAGIGTKVHYSTQINFDIRYSYVDEHRATIGIEYRF